MRLSVMRRFHRDDRGVAAIEFAFIGIMLLIFVIGMLELTRAITRNMSLNASVRAGAEIAMRLEEPDHVRDEIERIFEETHGGSYTLSGIDVTRYCACTDDVDIDPDDGVNCQVTCDSNNEMPYVFYSINATHTYESMFAGNIFSFDLSSSMRVQAMNEDL